MKALDGTRHACKEARSQLSYYARRIAKSEYPAAADIAAVRELKEKIPTCAACHEERQR